MASTLLTSAYWPNLHYFYYVLKSNPILIEQYDHYQKQSFRNRTSILSANGVLDLSIPVSKTSKKEYTKDIIISYKENWQIKHWRAITSAYKNSPYFEFFESDIKESYFKKYDLLMEYNTQQLLFVLRALRINKEILFTQAFEKEPLDKLDVREIIHPKNDFREDKIVEKLLMYPYYQTFSIKFGFAPNLSILDLVFNTGLNAVGYF